MYALNSAARLLVPGTLLVLGLANFVPAAVAQENDQSASQQADEAPAPPAPPRPAASPVSPDASDQAGAVETDDLGYETLLQGPVHEAFAAPIDADLTDGVRVYSEAPPKPINEQPPEQQPEGKDITWVPGYWSWSDDAGKYVWVSGLYRKAPPGRTWVAGYWTESGSGYRWTSGYWAPADSTIDQPQASRSEPKYLPMPPKSIDNGPSVPPPGEDYFWLPGRWDYVDGQYQWRSGYWARQPEGWVWQPACYIYAPNGYLYVDGYWDVLPPERGQLYAPVNFYQPVYQQPNYVYCPRYPFASVASLLTHLFVRPGYPHYFYGNFYSPFYASMGYRPWYDAYYGFSIFSPWIGYYDWRYRRSGIDFVGSMRRYKDHYRGNPSRFSDRGFQSDDLIDSRPAAAGPPQGASVKASPQSRSFDEVVRRDVGGKSFKRVGETSNQFARRGSDAASTRSQRSSLSPGVTSFPQSRSFNQGAFSSNPGLRGNSTTPSLQRRPPAANQPSRGRSLDSGPSRSGSPNMGRSFPQTNRVTPTIPPSSSFGRGSSPSFNSGRGSSIQRSAAPSFDRGSSAQRGPSLQSRGPSAGRGGPPALRGGGPSGASRSGFKGGGGGSKGRGRGK